MIVDTILFIIYAFLEFISNKPSHAEKLGDYHMCILMVGVTCILIHNYISAGEFIVFGIRVLCIKLKKRM